MPVPGETGLPAAQDSLVARLKPWLGHPLHAERDGVRRPVALTVGTGKPYGQRVADLMAVFEFQTPGLWLDQGLVGQRLQVPNGVGWIQFPSADEHLIRTGRKVGPLITVGTDSYLAHAEEPDSKT